MEIFMTTVLHVTFVMQLSLYKQASFQRSTTYKLSKLKKAKWILTKKGLILAYIPTTHHENGILIDAMF